jgi:hypothetical protein
MDLSSMYSVAIFGFSCIVLLGGIPCWIIGARRPGYYQSDVLISVPLAPEPQDLFSYWTVSPPVNLTIAVPLSKADGSAINGGTDLKIVHNLFGYNLSLVIQFPAVTATFSVARNAVIGRITDPTPARIDSSGLPGSLATDGYFRVGCPNPTAATSSIEPHCKRRIGGLMQLTDTYEVMHILEISEPNGTDLFVTFRMGAVVPTDFIDVPQMYIALWKKSNAESLVIGGGILTGAGLVVMVLTVVVFFAFAGGS